MFGMDLGLYLKLSAMMFLEFAVWGAWYPVLATRLLGPLKFSGKQTGWIYAALPLGCIFMPLVAGQVADRWINTEFILAGAHLVGTLLLFIAAWKRQIQLALHDDAAVRPVLCGDAAPGELADVLPPEGERSRRQSRRTFSCGPPSPGPWPGTS